ncbi:hypothetical protein LY76DRAFT_634498 [Colletotrichum caudatum]|nr:hypothetical protein LY76DRAFT_634498 [Colletotrichum caudatum]
MPLFDASLFLGDLMAGHDRFCSKLLVSAIMSWACVWDFRRYEHGIQHCRKQDRNFLGPPQRPIPDGTDNFHDGYSSREQANTALKQETFPSLCKLALIANDIMKMKSNRAVSKRMAYENLKFMESTYQRYLKWADSLPVELARGSESSQHVLILQNQLTLPMYIGSQSFFRLAGGIMRGLFFMALREKLMDVAEAKTLLQDSENKGQHHQPISGPIQAPFVVDLDLAMAKREAASVDKLVADFNPAMSTEFVKAKVTMDEPESVYGG